MKNDGRWLLACLFTFTTVSALAGPMTRNVESVMPRIGQRGTSVEVAIQGVSLEDPREVIFYKPGIRAVDIRPADEPPTRRGLMHGAWIDAEIRCTFVIDEDCEPGEHLFRIRTRTELTNIGTFHVSPFPVIDENEQQAYANDTFETAMPVSTNVTVRGVMSSWSKGDCDVYRVSGRAGQRLSVEVDSARIANEHYGDSEYDLALRILDSAGRVIAADDDNSMHVQDPLLSVTLEDGGDVFVEVRRSIFASRDTQYCIHIGDYRRPRAVFPPGAQSGTRQTFTFLGDPLRVYEEKLTFAEDAIFGPGRTVRYFGAAPSAMKIRACPYQNVIENQDADETLIDEIPAALNGIIDSATDSDAYRFRARKGDPLRVRVLAAGLGSPIDALIRIHAINPDGTLGKLVVEKDDSPVTDHDILGTGYRGGGGLLEAIDPSIMWTPEADGEYRLEVIDTSGLGGPTAVYRVEIERPRAVVHTYLASRTNDWTESMRVSGLVVPRGNRWTVNLSLSSGQANWPKNDFELVAHGLPKGVRLVTPRIKPGTTLWPIQLVADADAEPTASMITLEARSTDQLETVETYCQQSIPFINHSGGDAWRTVRTDRYVAAVTEPAPFSIDIDQPDVALVRGGRLSIPVRITRHGDFSGAVEFRCGFAPRSISIPPPTIIPPGEDEGVLDLSAQSSAPLETLPLVVLGSTVNDRIPDYLGAGSIRVSSEIVELTVDQPYVELAAEPESIRRGERKPFVWKVTHHSPFEGEATIQLLGLPKGVTVVGPAPVFTKDSTELAFQLEATDVALLGQATGLICEVSVPVGEQSIVQRTGNGKLRIDPRATEGRD